jgi:hypothetical protein
VDSPKLFVSWDTQEQSQISCINFAYRPITFYGCSFQNILLSIQFVTYLVNYDSALQPRHSKLCGLGFYVFARRYLRNTYLFLFLHLLRCFTSVGMLLGTAASDSCTLLQESFLIRRFPGKIVRHQPETYRSLTTSFIASLSQGIHPMLLMSY